MQEVCVLVLAGGGWRWSDVIIKYCQGVTLALHLLHHHPTKLVSWGLLGTLAREI